MISLVFKGCLTALVVGIIMGITVTLLALVVYLVSGIISSLVQTFKDVQAKNRAIKMLKAMETLAKATKEAKAKNNSQ